MPRQFVFPFLFAAYVFAAMPSVSHAQNKEDKGDKVRITTVDGVELYGKFYPCMDAKVKTPPTILMLHSIGENSAKKAWIALAETLQKKAAVLTFDFRGHGYSTDVDPALFWRNTVNHSPQYIKGAFKSAQDGKQTIDYKEFDKSYHRFLINDIAACKAFLDRKNDAGECNTSSLIVIGADTAATLGAVWINSEWYRHKVIQNPVNVLMTAPDPRAEGRDIIAGVWLSMSSQFGGRTISVTNTLDQAMIRNKVPMVFFYADGDAKGKAIANAAVRFAEGKNKAKYPFTGKVELKGGNLTGMGLLQKSLRVDEAIAAYLFGDPKTKTDGVVEAKQREWTNRDFKKTQYLWRYVGVPPGGPGEIANVINDKNLLFKDYSIYAK